MTFSTESGSTCTSLTLDFDTILYYFLFYFLFIYLFVVVVVVVVASLLGILRRKTYVNIKANLNEFLFVFRTTPKKKGKTDRMDERQESETDGRTNNK